MSETFRPVTAITMGDPAGIGPEIVVGTMLDKGIHECCRPFVIGSQAIMEKAQSLRLALLELVDADARAFAPLAQAYAIPKEDPSRPAALEAATWEACAAPSPLGVARGRLGLSTATLSGGGEAALSGAGWAAQPASSQR